MKQRNQVRINSRGSISLRFYLLYFVYAMSKMGLEEHVTLEATGGR